jgi:hypothetical protein
VGKATTADGDEGMGCKSGSERLGDKDPRLRTSSNVGVDNRHSIPNTEAMWDFEHGIWELVREIMSLLSYKCHESCWARGVRSRYSDGSRVKRSYVLKFSEVRIEEVQKLHIQVGGGGARQDWHIREEATKIK